MTHAPHYTMPDWMRTCVIARPVSPPKPRRVPRDQLRPRKRPAVPTPIPLGEALAALGYTDADRDVIMSDARTQAVSMMRMALIRELRSRGVPKYRVAAALRVDHSTVCYAERLRPRCTVRLSSALNETMGMLGIHGDERAAVMNLRCRSAFRRRRAVFAELRARGLSGPEIGRLFGTNHSTIFSALRGARSHP